MLSLHSFSWAGCCDGWGAPQRSPLPGGWCKGVFPHAPSASRRSGAGERVRRGWFSGPAGVCLSDRSYADGRLFRQVSQTRQDILDTGEIAYLREDETVVLVEGPEAR
jgi:hypothetical protein